LDKLSIKNWALDDRPREKLLSKGSESLSNAELIAILIGSGNKKESAVALSQRILYSTNNNLNELSKLTLSDLQLFSGIGEAKALSIIAALELGKRQIIAETFQKPEITSAYKAYMYLSHFLTNLPHEEFWILLLNNSARVISHHKMAQGGLNSTIIDVRLIAKKALENNALAVILAHNHPSGSLLPSQEDKSVTLKIKNALSLFDIKVFDHIIVGENNFFSFADSDML